MDYARHQLEAMDQAPPVTLRKQMADDFSGIEPQSFDVVVLNSIVQYFPDVDYLLAVLQGAVRSLRPGGAVFVGDVRSLPLLEAFHASVELSRAADEMPLSELRQRVERQMTQANELRLSPGVCTGPAGHLPEIVRVDIARKSGSVDSALTRLRV